MPSSRSVVEAEGASSRSCPSLAATTKRMVVGTDENRDLAPATSTHPHQPRRHYRAQS